MTFEKRPDTSSEVIERSGCSGCGQNNSALHQNKYGQQAQKQRSKTNKGSASQCSC